MRILLLSQWFDPEPTFKGLPFAQELVRRGHQVEVITGFPNYPGGKIYPGYRLRPWQREYMGGIPVLRVPLYPSHDRSVIKRILNYCSFSLSASIASLFISRPDVIYAYHPPATIALPALLAKAFYRVPLVYDIQDLWPDTIGATGMLRKGLITNLLSKWCRFVYRMADRLVVLSPGFKEALSNRGVPAEKIEVIYNWCDEHSIGPGTLEKSSLEGNSDDTFKVLFAGTMGLAQALDSVLKSAEICERAIPRVRFVFIGGGVDRDRLERQAREMGLSNVQFLERMPMSEMGNILSTADALLVHLKDDPLFRITIPSKTQAYLAAGKPVLMAMAGDAASLIQLCGGGVVCKPEDPQALAAAIQKMVSMGRDRLTEMGEAGRSFYARELSIRTGVERFERVFNSLVYQFQCTHS